MCGLYRTVPAQIRCENAVSAWRGAGTRRDFRPTRAYPAKFAAPKTARLANTVIEPAKIADLLNGHEFHEKLNSALKGFILRRISSF
jgi:hypothetical protein